MIAANRMSAALDEVRALADLRPVEWDHVASELAATLHTVPQVRAELEDKQSGLGAEAVALEHALDKLRDRVGNLIWQGALSMRPISLSPTTMDDRMVLARSAIAAARAQISMFQLQKPGEHRDQAIALCAPIRLHLVEASSAAEAVADRGERIKLAPDVEGLASDMKTLGALLSIEPKLQWDQAFAASFDAENHLRAVILGGGQTLPRPYSGTIDPEAAMNLVKGTKPDGTVTPAVALTSSTFADPQSAVNEIASTLQFAYQAQHDVLGNLEKHLREPRVPKTSLFDTLLNLAVEAVIAAASAGLATAVSRALGSSLRAAALAEKEAHSVLALDGEELTKTLATMIEPTDGRRALAVEMAKNVSKQLFKTAGDNGVKMARSEPSTNITLLSSFVEGQQHAVRAAQYSASTQMNVLSPALAQLDLATLSQAARELRSLPQTAADGIYDRALIEWENLRSQLARPTAFGTVTDAAARVSDPQHAPHDPDLNVSLRPGAEAIPGVLEIALVVDATPGATKGVRLSSMILRDGEPAATMYLRSKAMKLPDVGINRLYKLSFENPVSQIGIPKGPSGTLVDIGVGARQGFQAGTIDQSELRILKLYVSGSPLNLITAAGAVMFGEYDEVPDSLAIYAARFLIAAADNITTAALEE